MQVVPLSEDERLVLDDPRELLLREGEVRDWDEVTRLHKGERRSISLDVRVQRYAKGRMVRVFDVPAGARLHVAQKIRVDEGASWESVFCVRGGGEIHIRRALELCGRRAEAKLSCVGQLEGSSQFSVGDELFCLAPETKGQLRTKLVLRHEAQSEARGRIVITQNAVGSEAFEHLDHLVLGDRARALGIPELEVQTDDVKCGHGATTSRPSEAALFYLASRGMSAELAEQVIAQGFLEQALVDLPTGIQQTAFNILFA